MAYAILRTAKLKTMGAIGASLSHTYRERETPNADPSLFTKNQHSHSNKTEALAAIHERLPAKRRSNAVLAIEYFIGASPEFFPSNSGDAYFQDALTWLEERHGRENVVATSIHRDETSPHLVAYVVPLDEGRLNARKFLGGKAKLAQMQTEFAERVGRKHGLQRGVQGSVARHTTIKAYYAALEAAEKAPPEVEVSLTPQVTKKGLLGTRFGEKRETAEEIAQRVAETMRRGYEPAVKEAATARIQGRRAKEMAITAQRAQKSVESIRSRYKVLEEAFRGLTSEQVASVVRLIQGWKEKNSQVKVGDTSTREGKEGSERER